MNYAHALLKNTVTHHRFESKNYRFTHKFFWFKINLFSIDKWPSILFNYNKFGLYSYFDSDHIKIGHSKSLENYIQFLKSQQINDEIVDACIITQVRFLGYVFNPVSFIFLKDKDGQDHLIVEIGNTFNELKPYYAGVLSQDGTLEFSSKKLFYISPFFNHDNILNFKFSIVEGEMNVSIDSYRDDEKVLSVNSISKIVTATNLELVKQSLYKPFVTFGIIFFIHLHALILFLKGIKYFKKDEQKHLQQGILIWKTKK